MAGRVPDDKIDEVRNRADIVQVVSRSVTLRRAGRGFTGLCPFHGEKTPSFHVSPERQTFHCFGCGEGGNVFTFLMKIDGATFPEVLERLAREHGITLPRRAPTEGEQKARSEREQLLRVTAAARAFFCERLASNPRARAYLAERGVSEETIARFGIGYAEDAWSALADHLQRAGTPLPLADKAGLLIARRESGYYDRFRHRIIFPIEDLKGNTLAFGARVLPDAKTTGEDAKYLNSPETPLYDKGRVLFGLAQARDAIRREGRAVLVEGYFDAVLLAQAGIENVVAPCGTALTSDHVRLLRRFTRDVVALFDSDEAGRRATERAMHVFIEEEVQGLGASLPEGMDPDDFVRREGADALRERIARAVPLIEAWVAGRTEGVRSFAERARRAEEIGAVLRKVHSPIERDLYTRLAADRLGVDERLMRGAVGGAQTAAPAPVGASAAEHETAAQDPAIEKLGRAEESLLAQVLREPALLEDPGVTEVLGAFTSPHAREVARLAVEAGSAEAAVLIDRAEDPLVASLVSRLASLEPPLDARGALEIFRAGAWQLERMRLERESRALSREMSEHQRSGDVPADLQRRKADLTRELGKYKGMDATHVPPGSRG
ncbi:MAG: DNA primase [Deltaproteobacteria bacterium RBG_13_65_10]|nr:MAG: DNA primase [Deltaproteobacteria bacterium RBG_13_65_10]